MDEPYHPSRRTLLAALSTTTPILASAQYAGATSGRDLSANSAVSVTPEQFGALGDGVSDDSAALQRTFDAIGALGTGGVVILQPRVAYRCYSGLILDCSSISLWGQATLDFSGYAGPCIKVVATSSAPPRTAVNNYGHRGMIGGALRIRGGGVGRTSTGMLFDSSTDGTAAQLLVENLSISDCDAGIVFARRAYNSVFIKCDVYKCDVCVRWDAAEDNGERNTFIGCTLYNSNTAVLVRHPSAALSLQACSIDYTKAVYVVERGMVYATDCHHESSNWTARPFRCSGDGATIHINGGVVLGQARPLATDFLFEVSAGASIRIDGVFVHNIVLSTTGPAVTAWATGGGEFNASRLESYNMSLLPVRLHDGKTTLADPSFAANDWQDVLWRLDDDGARITSRHGTSADGLSLQRKSVGGQSALAVIKNSGTGALARMVPLCVPVRPGEQVLAGFQVRRDPNSPTQGAVVGVAPMWARIDGFDANRLPVITKMQSTGSLDLDLSVDRYVIVTLTGFRSNRVAPRWATHFMALVDLTRASPTTLLFRDLWGDAI